MPSRPEQFQQIIEDVLKIAKAAGASDAAAEVSEGSGLSVSVRKGEVENVERNRDKSVGVAIYIGQRRGNASTSDFSTQALEQTVRAAYDIARFTAEDPAAGLPDEQTTWPRRPRPPMDLDLFHRVGPGRRPRHRTVQALRGCGFRHRQAASPTPKAPACRRSSRTSGPATRRGFRGGYASSRHSLSVAPIAGKGGGMQRDHWYTSMRDANDMSAPEAVGRYAAERALSRLKSRKVATCEVPILFESSLAAGLLGCVRAGRQRRRAVPQGELPAGQPGHRGVPEGHRHLRVPARAQGQGQRAVRRRGRAHPKARDVVSAGEVQGYFLSSYSARKLGMKTTGHAGGSQNLRMTHRRTQPGDDLPEMLRKLDRGLFVIELMGQGVNYVTGDYSRGAAGFWVENGRIVHPVEEVTIAGHLRSMLMGIQAIGADTYNYGAKTVGLGAAVADEGRGFVTSPLAWASLRPALSS